mmetsp:Transcript_51111/g.136404  ORF Transcript_51111/g.136404 Transcript_51111/m.136404 type:complete len:249 (-) Transcript_51111:359-1105(-)
MPSVLCGLACFHAPTLSTAGDVALEFAASLDPLLGEDLVEVYRLDRVSLDTTLDAGDAVLCHVPQWGFDLAALEDLHRQLEELQEERETFEIQYKRMEEALMSLNSSVEVAESLEARPAGGDRENRREVHLLRQQLALSEKKQLETKCTVMALRSEFMHLVNIMNESAGHAPQLKSLGVWDLEAAKAGVGGRPGTASSRRAAHSFPATAGVVVRKTSNPQMAAGARRSCPRATMLSVDDAAGASGRSR